MGIRSTSAHFTQRVSLKWREPIASAHACNAGGKGREVTRAKMAQNSSELAEAIRKAREVS